jgi:predicted amidophosphoribosyltransferase
VEVRSPIDWLADLGRGSLELLLPARCARCRKRCEREAVPLCDGCDRTLPYIFLGT